jgi:photosystem II stability/assembly factor-like uncharacterized protein
MKFQLSLLFILCLSYGYSQQATTSSSPQHEEMYSSVEWRHVGPFRGGRSCAVTGVPGKPQLYYFGSTGGGVWKTENGGQSWSNISDGFFGGSIGAVSVSTSDNNVIYAGGGEKTVRGNVSYGYGVWRSEDAGKTWESRGLKKSRHISRLRIDSNDPDVVYAAVMGNLFADTDERGVYKSVDGGKNWKKVLFANEKSGAVDLIIDPNNSRILYATTWTIRRTPYSLSSGGEGSALWKSTDSGETWTNISANKGLPSGVWGISGVTVSPQNSDRVWAIIENKSGGVYRSDDAGKTWQKLNSERSLRQRAWYYTRIYADTQDEDVVYVVNVNYHKSKDGGKTFKSARAPHGDHHDMWIDPDDGDRMIMGDDGGAQVSYDGGGTWSTYHNQPTAQFYRVTTDNHFPYRIYVAQQDNSTLRIPHRTMGSSITESDWERTAGGESAHIAVDPTDNDIVYGGSYDGFLTRMDHKTDQTRAINVWPDNPMGHGAEGMKYRFQWNFPIFFSKHDPQVLYTASNHLHRTTDEGQTWEIISPDLTRNDPEKLKSSGGPITQDNTSVEYYCTIFAAQESPLKEGLIWVGSDDGLVHLTKDGGENWINITPAGMPKWLMINCIEPDPHNEAGCYLAGTLYKDGDFQPYLYKTSNYGATWNKITTGIDKEHFTRVIRADPEQEGYLYAGTESGMYISKDDGRSWKTFQLNLPIVPITDLVIKNDNLIAATQGRSIWMIDDLSTVRSAMALSKVEDHLFKPSDAYRMRGGQNKKAKGVGMNHPGGVNVHYYLKDYDAKEDSIALTFRNAEGEVVRTYNSKAKEKVDSLAVELGANNFNWNMQLPAAKKFKGMVFWWGSLAGPKVVPGKYTVELSVNETVQTQEFEILKDPRVPYSQEELQQQYAFISSINAKVTEAHEDIIEMRKLKKQMKDFLKQHESPKVKQKIEVLDSTLSVIEKTLYQTQNRSRQDPLNFPIRLTNKLAHLNSLSQMSDGPPTASMLAVQAELTEQIDQELAAYRALKSKEVQALNDLIRSEITDFIKLEEPAQEP